MNYENKASDYYSNIRLDLVELIDADKKNLKVLEIGAAYGETLNYLKENGIANEAVGIELYEDKNNTVRYKKIDKFIFGNINEIQIPEYDNYFDLILLPDVLEHIFEPKIALAKAKKFLKEDGEMIVSMPNIRHYSAFVKIFIKGNFQYDESGLFDYTHARFYCKSDIIKLLEDSNFKIIKIQSSITNFKGKSFTKVINLVTFGIFEQFFSFQYFFKIKKV